MNLIFYPIILDKISSVIGQKYVYKDNNHEILHFIKNSQSIDVLIKTERERHLSLIHYQNYF